MIQATENELVKAWHHRKAWPEVEKAISSLKNKYELFVHANGTTRLQLDVYKSSWLQDCFHMLFSSELLGSIKPAPESYVKALGLF